MRYKVSICIPAYKRTDFLLRLLKSIEIQTYKNFEVVISDDSNDNSVEKLTQQFTSKFKIKYFKNSPALGTPANWNFAISKADGEWIKIMHDDDWFSNDNSLALFAEETQKENKFIFSAYTNQFEESTKEEIKRLPSFVKNRIIKYPFTLIADNVIGPPSVTMLHRSILETYDERLKWRVDQEFYIRVLKNEKSYSYINTPLINVGISTTQVTQSCFNVPSVELPEGYILLAKYGTKPLKNIIVYDAWWRMIRNINIRKKEQLETWGQRNWPKLILNIVKHQSFISNKMLKVGIVSKLTMSFSYCINLLQSNF